MKRILRYLKGTKDLSIVYNGRQNRSITLEGYCDTNWGGNQESRHSTIGFIFKIYRGAVSWNSKKQSMIALSSTKAKYISVTQAAKEAIWLRQLLKDMGYEQKALTILYEDNQGCIMLSKNPVYHARTKHIDIQHHFIREKVEQKQVELKYCPMNKMIIDILTKPIPRDQFKFLHKRIAMNSRSSLSGSIK